MEAKKSHVDVCVRKQVCQDLVFTIQTCHVIKTCLHDPNLSRMNHKQVFAVALHFQLPKKMKWRKKIPGTKTIKRILYGNNNCFNVLIIKRFTK